MMKLYPDLQISVCVASDYQGEDSVLLSVDYKLQGCRHLPDETFDKVREAVLFALSNVESDRSNPYGIQVRGSVSEPE